MANTSRTLELVLRAKDFFTRTFATAGRQFIAIVRGTFGLGFNVLRSGMALVKNAVFGLGAAFAGVFAVSRMSAFAASTLEEADALHKLSMAMGTTTERMSELKAAFEFSGIGADFEKTLRGLTKAMSQIFTRGVDTRQGNALKQLGIDLGEIRSSDPLSLLQGIAKGLEQYGSESEKAAVMTGIFGDAFDSKLLVLLGQGEAAFLANIDAAKLYGATLRGDLAAAAEAAGDQVGFLKLQFGTAFRDAVLGVAKALTPVLVSLNKLVSSMRPELVAGIEAVIRMLIRFGFAVTNIVLVVLEHAIFLIQLLLKWINELLGGLESMGIRIPAALRSLFTPLSAEAAEVHEQMVTVAEDILNLEKALRAARAGGSAGREDLGGGVAEAIQRDLDAAKGKLGQLHEALADLSKEGAAGALSMVLDTARIGQLREILDLWREQALAQFDIAASTDTATTAIEKQAQAQEKNTEAADGFFARMKAGFIATAKTYADFLATVQSSTTQLLESGGMHLEDMFHSWVTGAAKFRDAFRDMTLSVLSDIARWIIKLQLLAIWQAITRSFAAGGGATAAADAGGGVAGGVDTGPGFGYSAPGAGGGGLRQLSGGGSRLGGGPLGGGQRGLSSGARGGGSAAVTLNMNIYATDGESVRQMLVKERKTILAVLQDGIATSRETRLAIRGATQ